MLGVAPDASSDEIRAAYRRLAFERHPDRSGDRTPEGVARAESGMAALNEAVATLTDPLRRQRYDTSRHATGSVAGPAPAHGTRPDAMSTGGPPYPHAELDHAGPVAVLARVGPWLTLLLVLGAIFVFTAYAGGGDDEPSDGERDPAVAVRDVRGSCIQRSGGFTLVVNCAVRPNEGRIVAQASPDAGCPAGTEGWLVPQEEFRACTDPSTASP